MTVAAMPVLGDVVDHRQGVPLVIGVAPPQGVTLVIAVARHQGVTLANVVAPHQGVTLVIAVAPHQGVTSAIVEAPLTVVEVPGGMTLPVVVLHQDVDLRQDGMIAGLPTVEDHVGHPPTAVAPGDVTLAQQILIVAVDLAGMTVADPDAIQMSVDLLDVALPRIHGVVTTRPVDLLAVREVLLLLPCPVTISRRRPDPRMMAGRPSTSVSPRIASCS